MFVGQRAAPEHAAVAGKSAHDQPQLEGIDHIVVVRLRA